MAIRIFQQQPDSLEQLASNINCAHERIAVALRRTWEEGKIIGQWLIEAKAMLNQHGQWRKWVADNLTPSLRSCQVYMKSVKSPKTTIHFEELEMPKNGYANRKALKRADYYPTPPSLVWELLKTKEMQGRHDFWEPACGQGAISNEFIKAGFEVEATDIKYGDDFLLSSQWHDTIVTNPPFSLFDEFVQKAKTSCSLFAFIAKTNFFGAYQRHEQGIWRNLKNVYIFNRQVDYRSPIRKDGRFHVGNLITGWFIWDMDWHETYWLTEIMDVQQYAKLGQK